MVCWQGDSLDGATYSPHAVLLPDVRHVERTQEDAFGIPQGERAAALQ
jgi:hypothetical protein